MRQKKSSWVIFDPNTGRILPGIVRAVSAVRAVEDYAQRFGLDANLLGVRSFDEALFQQGKQRHVSRQEAGMQPVYA